jgi:hypothetical protein
MFEAFLSVTTCVNNLRSYILLLSVFYRKIKKQRVYITCNWVITCNYINYNITTGTVFLTIKLLLHIASGGWVLHGSTVTVNLSGSVRHVKDPLTL